ncbi:MAG: SDR family NAD(P)-dependent oxidoreductase [Pseudomonadota bacterium]|nr:SDR family NAD(P)-dependent oxidoreductase [Pseudomonadota bacterium]
MSEKTILIFGAGHKLSASIARLFSKNSFKVYLVARDIGKLKYIENEIGATLFEGDVSDLKSVLNVFQSVDKISGSPGIVIFNPSVRIKGAIEQLCSEDVEKAFRVNIMGAFYVAQQAAIRMTRAGSGSIFFTGATAGIKGFANSSVFAMGKFSLRGLAQSLARELHPQNIHVGHFVIDGKIQDKSKSEDNSDRGMDPDELAKTYLHFHTQQKSCWSWEVELRHANESF